MFLTMPRCPSENERVGRSGILGGTNIVQSHRGNTLVGGVLLPPGISVLVLTGLAMFGVGSRASAGFMYHAELAPAAGMADDDMAQTLNDSPSKAAPEVTPSVPAEPTPLRTVI